MTTTLQGLGGFDELDPKSLHMLGMHGSAYANMAMQEADLIIALGARFDETASLDPFHALLHKLARLLQRGGVESYTSKSYRRILTRLFKRPKLLKVMSPQIWLSSCRTLRRKLWSRGRSGRVRSMLGKSGSHGLSKRRTDQML